MGTNIITNHLIIPSEFGYERVAVSVAASIAQTIHIPQRRIKDLEVAISEACINAFEHAYPGKTDSEVVVAITVNESAFTVDVKDFGIGGVSFDPNAKRDEWSRGWGLHLIQKHVDAVAIQSTPGSGTLIHMTIRYGDNGDGGHNGKNEK
jgi:serine/threonine-protein kinase RsbW